MLRMEMIIDAKAQLGEGPLWDVTEERLYWIDSLGPAVHSCDLKGDSRRTWPLPEPIGSLALRHKGDGAVLALKSGFHFLDFISGEVTRIVDPDPGKPRIRMNDGKVDRRGRFIAGSMHCPESEGLGSLYRLDTDLSVHKLDKDIICSNGPAFSPDGRTLYFNDSVRRVIYAYDYDLDSGAASNRRVFVSTEQEQGAPDGGTVDAEGYIWSAQIISGRIVRYAPDGKVDRIIEFPAALLTSVMFGGPNLDVLYVTTMGKFSPGVADFLRKNPVPAGKSVWPGEYGVGALFAVHGLGVRGIAEPRFAG
jgi:sugar lactone lactonase YvrE